MLDEEVDFLIDAVRQLQEHASEWGADYRHDPHTNEFRHMAGDGWMQKRVESWFEAPKRGVSVLA
jgi:hypothetical protein